MKHACLAGLVPIFFTQSHAWLPASALAASQPTPPSPLLAAFFRYVREGFCHVIPDGLDHILFIVGLILLGSGGASLLLQITVFTMAHSLSLGLALFGLLSVPSQAVEVAVAVSIAFIAAENLLASRQTPWRLWIVGGFGLVHGLAFAHTFIENPPVREDLWPALFGFNCGVEIGQLAVVVLFLVLTFPWQEKTWYRRGVVIPASALIAIAGLALAVERSFAL